MPPYYPLICQGYGFDSQRFNTAGIVVFELFFEILVDDAETRPLQNGSGFYQEVHLQLDLTA